VSDDELVELARSGDHAAFGELVDRHQQAVFRTALAALRSREEAEEVTQDTLVAAFQELGRFRGASSFKTWLLAIAWNRARDRRRSLGRWLRRFVNRDGDAWFEPRAAGPSQEDVLIATESHQTVRALLGTLPAKYRDALLLSAFTGQTFEEIGKVLGVPTGTAKWQAMEARRLLRAKLVSRGVDRGRG
jgi:RNA polymerase sigma-70 factor (ECF subfamily)